MESSSHIAIPIMVVLCLLSFPTDAADPKAPAPAGASEEFFVEGDVFCDVCRMNTINKLSEPLNEAQVKIECHGSDPKNVTYHKLGATNANGHYRVKVKKDHGTEKCLVKLHLSNRPDCKEIPKEGAFSDVKLTVENGIKSDVRFAAPLGFLKDKAAPQCAELAKDKGGKTR